MSGGWAGSDRRERLPVNWPKLRAQVRKRAGGRCEWSSPVTGRCPSEGSQCDHVNRGDVHLLVNLQWLCTHHHNIKSAREGREARAEKAARGKRPAERHPGSIRRK